MAITTDKIDVAVVNFHLLLKLLKSGWNKNTFNKMYSTVDDTNNTFIEYKEKNWSNKISVF